MKNYSPTPKELEELGFTADEAYKNDSVVRLPTVYTIGNFPNRIIVVTESDIEEVKDTMRELSLKRVLGEVGKIKVTSSQCTKEELDNMMELADKAEDTDKEWEKIHKYLGKFYLDIVSYEFLKDFVKAYKNNSYEN